MGYGKKHGSNVNIQVIQNRLVSNNPQAVLLYTII